MVTKDAMTTMNEGILTRGGINRLKREMTILEQTSCYGEGGTQPQDQAEDGILPPKTLGEFPRDGHFTSLNGSSP
jgi:hypothetical protein